MTDRIYAQLRVALLSAACAFGAIAAGLPSTAQAQASESNICAIRGYTVGFFNGVWNTLPQAIDGRLALQELMGDEYNSEPVEYENFYNNTGNTAGGTMAQDIAEVFIQRANEFDDSGEFARRFEYIWEASTNLDRPLLSRLWASMSAPRELLETIYTSIMTKVFAGWSYLLSNPPTELNYAQHRLTIDTLATEGQKMLFVAHSQGNLFVNPAFDYAKSKLSSNSVAAVHIAPASLTLRGPHVLADIDAVINGLRAFGWDSVPPVNLNLPLSSRDASGHTLVDTYLDGSRAGRARVEEMGRQGLASLATPDAIGSRGFFTTMLTWDGAGDVDLHTFEPGGAHVYYSSMRGQVGALDVDNTWANGPEHYYASCDPARLQEGSYRIGINNYARAAGRTATVQVTFAQGGQPVTRVLDVGPVRGAGGDSSPIPVLTVNITKDANGSFRASAQ